MGRVLFVWVTVVLEIRAVLYPGLYRHTGSQSLLLRTCSLVAEKESIIPPLQVGN